MYITYRANHYMQALYGSQMLNTPLAHIEVGKDGDLALFDGDPFEYTTHCTGVVIEGEVVSRAVR